MGPRGVFGGLNSYGTGGDELVVLFDVAVRSRRQAGGIKDRGPFFDQPPRCASICRR
jgi:hypothetical protein